MLAFLNGEFIPEEKATVSVLDRGFLYGDGLFETVRVYNGIPFRWAQHLERLEQGRVFLNIQSGLNREDLTRAAHQLIRDNNMPEAILRLTVSRGSGPRGYSPKGVFQPTTVMTLHAVPAPSDVESAGLRLATASIRLPAGEPLANIKSCNKLSQILARSQAEAVGADEALLLNTDGNVCEAAASNIFWIERNAVRTPPLSAGMLAGVTRAIVFELCEELGIPVCEANADLQRFQAADGAFACSSVMEVAEISSLNGVRFSRSPLAANLQTAYRKLVKRETETRSLPASEP